jgi:hypothetical protein
MVVDLIMFRIRVWSWQGHGQGVRRLRAERQCEEPLNVPMGMGQRLLVGTEIATIFVLGAAIIFIPNFICFILLFSQITRKCYASFTRHLILRSHAHCFKGCRVMRTEKEGDDVRVVCTMFGMVENSVPYKEVGRR